MNKTEQIIYEAVIKEFEHRRFMNNAWLKQIWWNKRSSDFIKLKEVWLYREEIPLLDYLDWRRNIIEIPNFCKFTWEKVSKQKIKKELKKHLI